MITCAFPYNSWTIVKCDL